MRLLFPEAADDVDPADLYAADDRRRHADGRPWLLVNMIASLDGATAVGGVSGPLGGPADKRVFAAVRGVADVILVAAGTVRAEGYGPANQSDPQQARRVARGQARMPRLAICTASLALDLEAPLFTAARDGDGARPLVLTTTDSDPARREAVAGVAEVVTAGAGAVDLRAAVTELGARGASVVLAEGGPRLNGQLVAAGLVDELCLSVSPHLASGESARIAHGDELAAPHRLHLARILEADGYLFVRYARLSAASGPSTS